MTGTGIVTFIDDSKLETVKVDLPDSIVDLDQANTFADQSSRDIDVGLLPTEDAASGDFSNFIVPRVFNFPKGSGEGPLGRTVQIPRPSKVDSLMRTFIVVLRPESVESALLRSTGGSHRPRRLPLELPVHAFMLAVFFRMSEGDLLGPDPQLDPPH